MWYNRKNKENAPVCVLPTRVCRGKCSGPKDWRRSVVVRRAVLCLWTEHTAALIREGERFHEKRKTTIQSVDTNRRGIDWLSSDVCDWLHQCSSQGDRHKF